MVDSALFAAISKYFEGRAHYEDSPTLADFKARTDAFEYYDQAQGLGADFSHVRALPITLETMIGFPATRVRHLQELDGQSATCAKLLSGRTMDGINITGTSLMINGSSLPLKIDYEGRRGNETGISKTMYLKPYDPMRLLGLEMYTLLARLEDHYHYYFNSGIIVEEAVEGVHEDQLDGSQRFDPVYRRERAKSDLLSWFMGLDDLAKIDNYIVTPGKRLIFIDFDVMDRPYTSEDLERIKVNTAQALSIPRTSYDILFAYEAAFLRRRIADRRDELGQLLDLLRVAADIRLREMANYISNNLLRLWGVQRLK